MGEDKDIIKEIISAWGENFENHLDKMVLEGLGGWFTKPIKAKRIPALKRIPTLTGRISKIKPRLNGD